MQIVVLFFSFFLETIKIYLLERLKMARIHVILNQNESFLRRVQILMAFPYDYRGPDSG